MTQTGRFGPKQDAGTFGGINCCLSLALSFLDVLLEDGLIGSRQCGFRRMEQDSQAQKNASTVSGLVLADLLIRILGESFPMYRKSKQTRDNTTLVLCTLLLSALAIVQGTTPATCCPHATINKVDSIPRKA